MIIDGKNRIIIVICILCTIIFFSSCKSTPNEQAVKEKDSMVLENLLQQTAAEDQNISDMGSTEVQDIWKYKKEFESGSVLFIEATSSTHNEKNAPVAAIQEKIFTSTGCKKIIQSLVPDSNVYNYEITKDVLENEILYYKEMLHKAKTDIDYFYDEDGQRLISFGLPDDKLPATDEEWAKLTIEDELTIILEDLEKKYAEAPTEAELEKTDYQFKILPESEQLNLTVSMGNQSANINFVNWTSGIKGSEFIFSANDPYLGDDIILDECVDPSVLDGDEGFEASQRIARDFISKVGVDYMEPEWVTKGKDATGKIFHTICFTRVINGFPENHTSDYLGTVAFDPEFGRYQELWQYEYFKVTVKDNNIVSANWRNPGEIAIENDNVKIISWEEAQKAFLKQMDRLMSPTVSHEDLQLGILGDHREIYINKIELGLTKILMAESGEYKLIPTWNFSGYDKSHLFNNPETAGAITCFVTINAVDGSIIDRGLMY